MPQAILRVSRVFVKQADPPIETWAWPFGTRLERRPDLDNDDAIGYLVDHPDIPDGATQVTPIFRTTWDDTGGIAGLTEFNAWNPSYE